MSGTNDNRSLANFNDGWANACERLMAAVAPSQRRRVQGLLSNPSLGGRGIRMWVQNLMRAEDVNLPSSVPETLVQVYFDDAEAIPLHDCEQCGVPLPVRPGLAADHSEPERVYFERCPICGGRAGLYAFWSRSTDGNAAKSEPEINDSERRQRVRRIAR